MFTRLKRLGRRRPSPGLVVAIGALVLAAGGITYAAIPAPDGEIHGCYFKAGVLGTVEGQLRVIDHDKPCNANETRITWSQQGPEGEPGAPGAPGAPGQPGQSGTSRAFAARNTNAVFVDENGNTVVSKTLPAGKYVLNASVSVFNFDSANEVHDATCRIPGHKAVVTNLGELGESGSSEIFALNSAIIHGGGAVELICSKLGPSGSNTHAIEGSITAIKVDSIE